MTTMISEVYSAFRTAGAPEQEARKAAEALSAENLATKNDVAEVKQEIIEVKQELTSNIIEVKEELTSNIIEVKEELTGEISGIKREVAVVKWMLGIVIIAVVLPLLKPIAGI